MSCKGNYEICSLASIDPVIFLMIWAYKKVLLRITICNTHV